MCPSILAKYRRKRMTEARARRDVLNTRAQRSYRRIVEAKFKKGRLLKRHLGAILAVTGIEFQMHQKRVVADCVVEGRTCHLHSMTSARKFIDNMPTKKRPTLAYLRTLSKSDLESQIADMINEVSNELLDTEHVSGDMATTNATDFDVEDVEVWNVEIGQKDARAEFAFVVQGEQDEDKPWSGTKINGSGIVIISADGSVKFTDVVSERDLDE